MKRLSILLVGLLVAVALQCKQQEYVTLTIEIYPANSGGVVLNPGGLVYEKGSKVQLTIVERNGFKFGGWGGKASGTELQIVITMDADKTVAAHFWKPRSEEKENSKGEFSCLFSIEYLSLP